MASFGKKKKISEYLYSKPGIAFVLVVVVFLAISVYERFSVEREMSRRRVETELHKQELLERKAALQERVEYLSGDRGIEEEIRRHFDVAKEGEKVIILVGDKNEKKPEVGPEPEIKPWYKFW